MATPEPPAEPTISSISSFEWSSEESVAYEAAIEAVNGAVGAYTARISAEESRPAPNGALIAGWLEEQGRCARVREGLIPADHAQIAEARRHYAAVARELMEGL